MTPTYSVAAMLRALSTIEDKERPVVVAIEGGPRAATIEGLYLDCQAGGQTIAIVGITMEDARDMVRAFDALQEEACQTTKS